jgi:predicted acylesterase/phospholipase RssA
MEKSTNPTLGLALSGSGNRTTFYIGFLEVLDEAGIKIDYISACSGGCLVAAAYACGTLPQIKEMALALNFKGIREIMTKEKGKGGLYKLDYLENILNTKFTKGLHFDEVKPIMVFTAVDIENGELVDLCIGEIARAARISCTTPALFESVKWGNRVLVDGGVLSVVPSASLKKFSPDVTVSLDLAQTPYIFTGVQISAKKVYNFVKKFLLINQMMDLVHHVLPEDTEVDFEKSPKLFGVWGKSLDLAMYANNRYSDLDGCDLAIKPNLKNNNRVDLSSNAISKYYQMGRQVAEENLPKIKELIKAKSNG